MIPNSKEKQSFLQTSGQDAGTQCLSRTSGQDAPTADARRLSRLRRTHSVFSRTSGRDTPTAFSKKANCDEFVFHSTGKALQKQGGKRLKTQEAIVLHPI